MAGKTREIANRIKAVGNIQRITKTMQMIATARFQAALRAASASKPYTQQIASLVAELSGAGQSVQHPLLGSDAKPAGRSLMLVLTSNRGLCGGYNGNVLRNAQAFLKQHKDPQTDIEVVGNKGRGYFNFTGREIAGFHEQFGDKPRYEDVEALAEDYMQRFSSGQFDAVHIAYMSFQSVARQTPTVLQLLPLEDPSAGEEQTASGKPTSNVNYEFSPAPGQLLNELLPITVKTQLFQCFNDAVVSEQVARMVAMKNATDAASKMEQSLTRVYNRVRQTAITTELMEVISGAAAIK
jgi:F-type H+-transporting ATPase subunit gamma